MISRNTLSCAHGIMQPAVAARASTFVCLRCSRLQKLSSVLPACVSNSRFLKAQSVPQKGRLEFRLFHRSPNLAKKKDKSTKRDSHAENEASGASRASEDPFDYSELEESISKAHTKFKDALSKLRGGGKFNPEALENLRVQLSKDNKETARLADLAQCVLRGRVLNIIAGEKEHIKAISSTIHFSDLSLNPQPDSQNPLQLNVQLPPPTTESRNRAVQDAIKLAETANIAVRNARGAQQKRLRAMQLARSARPDDLKKAGDKMEKIVADGISTVKITLENAKKHLESG